MGAQPQCIVTAETGIGSPGLPFYTREQLARSPSVHQGMDPDTERRNRLQYTLFIQQVGMDLEVPQWSIYTAVYLCHHYFAKRSYQRSDKYLVAVACLYLGCKVQESPKYLRDVIQKAETRKWAKWWNEHPQERRKWEDPDHLEQVRAEVLTAERAVLYTLCFQLRIQTPYATVLALIKGMDEGQEQASLTQIAWSLVNDSLKTQASLMFPPEQIGAACVYYAFISLGMEPRTPKGSSFCEVARITADQLEEILGMLVSVYTTVQLPQDSTGPPATKMELFTPQEGPGLQIRHDRLTVVSQPQPQQQQQQEQPVRQQSVPRQQEQQQPDQQQHGTPHAVKEEAASAVDGAAQHSPNNGVLSRGASMQQPQELGVDPE